MNDDDVFFPTPGTAMPGSFLDSIESAITPASIQTTGVNMSPKKKLIAIRASDMTIKQLDDLTQVLGMSQTELLTVALDRLYNDEMGKSKLTARAYERIEGDPDLDYYSNAIFDQTGIDETEFIRRLRWALVASKEEIMAWGEKVYQEIEEEPRDDKYA